MSKRTLLLALDADDACRLLVKAGLEKDEADQAVSYMLDFPELAEPAKDALSLALCAAEWHEGCERGNLWDSEHDEKPEVAPTVAAATHARTLAALEALKARPRTECDACRVVKEDRDRLLTANANLHWDLAKAEAERDRMSRELAGLSRDLAADEDA